MQTNRSRATDTQSLQLLGALLAERAAILAALAPEGWSNSPLRRIFHPTAEQQYEEAVRMRENLKALLRLSKKKLESEEDMPPPRPEDFTEDPPGAGNPEDELTTLLGDCLWLIFSDNHTVYDRQGRACDLGTKYPLLNEVHREAGI